MWLKKLFGLADSAKKTEKSPGKLPPPQLPETFKIDINLPNPPEINFNNNEIEIVWIWEREFKTNEKIYKILIGDTPDNFIFFSKYSEEPDKLHTDISLEKKNLPVFISVLEEAARGVMNFTKDVSIINVPPDAIKMDYYGDKYDHYTLTVSNLRNVLINGDPIDMLFGRSMIFDGLKTSELVEGLKTLLTPQQKDELEMHRSEFKKAAN